jgi:GT2 family glycosyltransferase
MIRAIGTVVIGRNEGERLCRCLESLSAAGLVVYVDSGSSDDSVACARSRGANVVELDASILFTAARARNEGFRRLLERDPKVTFVQFVDGDCELAPGWLEKGRRVLESGPELAVVCGRCRERHPDRSIYNRLCDIEWDQPIGQTDACGGIALMRVSAVKQVGGFNPNVLAAEDNEICLRLRQQGWKVQRIDAEMTVHDANIRHFSQWWRRAVRCGYAFAQGAHLHGAGPEGHFVRERRRAVLWGGVLPLAALLAAWPTAGWSLLLVLLYPLQMQRIYQRTRRRQLARPAAAAWAVSCVAAKFAECYGICKFAVNQLARRSARLIEYK